MKTCAKCKQEKGRSEFGSAANRPDGLYNYCKCCKKDDAAAYYAANKQRVAKSNRLWIEANRDKSRAIHTVWRRANRKYAKSWAAANPERARALGKVGCANRRAKAYNADGTITADVWLSIVESQSRLCALCKTNSVDRLDHRLAFALGGSNLPENIQGICVPCDKPKVKHENALVAAVKANADFAEVLAPKV